MVTSVTRVGIVVDSMLVTLPVIHVCEVRSVERLWGDSVARKLDSHELPRLGSLFLAFFSHCTTF